MGKIKAPSRVRMPATKVLVIFVPASGIRKLVHINEARWYSEFTKIAVFV